MDIKQLYPFFKKDTRLVLEPVGGLMTLPSAGDLFKKRPKLELNPLAVEIVKLCTGNKTCLDIVREVDRKMCGDGFDIADAVGRFLTDLARQELIWFSDVPVESTVIQVGSTDYFTPLHFSIELTDYCNLLCRHCYRESGPQGGSFLPTEKLLLLLETMERMGVSSVELTGGEPLTHPDFNAIFAKAEALFNRVGVVSNGTLIDDDTIAAFSKSAGNCVVQIDLDGDSAQIHDSLRGVPGSFDKICAAAQKMADKGIRFRCVMNVYHGNLSRIRETAALARKLGARQFSFASVLAVGRATKIPKFSETELRELIGLVNELEAAYPDFIQITSQSQEEGLFLHQKGNCGGGSRSLVLGPTGNVRPCLMLGEEHGIYGNLLREDYQVVMQRAPLAEHYQLLIPDEYACEGCDYLYFCKGCFSRPFHARSDAARQGKPFACKWNDKTKYFDIMKQLS